MQIFKRTLLIVAAGVGLVACEAEGPLNPRTLKSGESTPLQATVNNIEVRVYNHAEGWSQWEAIVDSMGAQLPEDQVLVMQFRQNDRRSSLAGFSWPELDTCFIMPEHVEGNSVWRVTYGPEGLPYPTGGRVEMRHYETHVTQAAAREMWYKAEIWDEVTASYVDESPWFAVRWVATGFDLHPHQEDTESE